MTKTRVLFVCLGNICRSPMAEAVFNHHVKLANRSEEFVTDSCGTANYHVGDWPDPRTIKTVRGKGIAISHTGRQLSKSDFENFDWILAMDGSNLRNIISMAPPSYSAQVRLMREFDPHGNGDVPDPYYGGEPDFLEVFEILSRSTKKFLDSLEEK